MVNFRLKLLTLRLIVSLVLNIEFVFIFVWSYLPYVMIVYCMMILLFQIAINHNRVLFTNKFKCGKCLIFNIFS